MRTVEVDAAALQQRQQVAATEKKGKQRGKRRPRYMFPEPGWFGCGEGIPAGLIGIIGILGG